MIPFTQFTKHEKHRERSVNFNKVAGLLNVTLLYRRFSRFLNCVNCTKLPKTLRIDFIIDRIMSHNNIKRIKQNKKLITFIQINIMMKNWQNQFFINYQT